MHKTVVVNEVREWVVKEMCQENDITEAEAQKAIHYASCVSCSHLIGSKQPFWVAALQPRGVGFCCRRCVDYCLEAIGARILWPSECLKQFKIDCHEYFRTLVTSAPSTSALAFESALRKPAPISVSGLPNKGSRSSVNESSKQSPAQKYKEPVRRRKPPGRASKQFRFRPRRS